MRIEGNSRPVSAREQGQEQTAIRRVQAQHQEEPKREIFSRKMLDEDRTKRIREQLEAEIERLSQVTRAFDRRMNFLLHEQADRIFVQIIDMETDAIIREVPPEEVLDLIASIRNMMGVFLDRYI